MSNARPAGTKILPAQSFTIVRRGRRGRRGFVGRMPAHEWSADGTRVRFETEPGIFGPWSSPASESAIRKHIGESDQ